MSLFDWPATYGQLKDQINGQMGLMSQWAAHSGLMGAAGGGAKRGGGRSWDDEWEEDVGASREDFASRVQLVHMHLNLAVRPCLLSNSRDFEVARNVLRESYAEEAIFKWLLGDVSSKKDPGAAQMKTDLLLDWMVDWRISTCQSNSHCLAIPASANNPSASRAGAIPSSSASSSLPLDLRGCGLVSCPGSKSNQVMSLMSLLAYGASPPTPPEALGQSCKARFAALEHHSRARDRLGSHTPHWYIHMLAVSPEHRGKGIGRMMMRIVSALADQDAVPVQLQVSGCRNKAYFEKCGFRVMEAIDICCDDSPTLKLFNMTRVPFPKSICLDNVSPPR